MCNKLSISFAILLLLSSCYQTKKTNHSIINQEENEFTDSLKLDEILIEALNISTQNIDKNIFYKEYEINLDNGSNVKIQINLDYHFTTLYSHLIIHRNTVGDIYIDIYSKNNNKFEKVLSHKEWTITYINDTIQDINGDSYKDFVINGYGSSGCCLKAYSLVYLFRPNNFSFSDYFDFLNPTFSPKENVIRGVCYGHPRETEMYKYKWNGEAVDTIEYVYYEKDREGNQTGSIIVSKTRSHEDNQNIIKRLKYIPIEYQTIYGYDWFTGEGYED